MYIEKINFNGISNTWFSLWSLKSQEVHKDWPSLWLLLQKQHGRARTNATFEETWWCVLFYNMIEQCIALYIQIKCITKSIANKKRQCISYEINDVLSSVCRSFIQGYFKAVYLVSVWVCIYLSQSRWMKVTTDKKNLLLQQRLDYSSCSGILFDCY